MKIADIKVDLLRVDGSDIDVVNAARVSFDKTSEPESDGSLAKRDAKLIRYLARNGHWTPMAHVGAQFRVKAPIFVARQLAKHQVGLVLNEVSRRYVSTAPEYMDIAWRWAAENVKQGSAAVMIAEQQEKVDAVFWDAVAHADRAYHEMLALGVAPEQARAVLCLNHMTEWVWTGSLVAWSRVCHLRLDDHAQAETREVVTHIDRLLRPAFPVTWWALQTNGLEGPGPY